MLLAPAPPSRNPADHLRHTGADAIDGVGCAFGCLALSPFALVNRAGPIRLDAAVPIDPRPGDPEFAVYFGIGQSF